MNNIKRQLKNTPFIWKVLMSSLCLGILLRVTFENPAYTQYFVGMFLILLPGYYVSLLLVTARNNFEQLLIGFTIGLTLIPLVLFNANLLGIPISPQTTILTSFIISTIAYIFYKRQGH